MALHACPRSAVVAIALAVLAFDLNAAQPSARIGSDAPGMYSNYTDHAVASFDSNLADVRAITMQELLPLLLQVIDQLSKYPRPKTLPGIHRVPRHVIEDMVCARECGVRAAYRLGEGIYIDERMQPETSVFDRSVLLHELVHFVQHLADERGEMEPCKRWYYREMEAYAIQKQFLMLVGSPVRVGYSVRGSTCDESIDSLTARSLYDSAEGARREE